MRATCRVAYEPVLDRLVHELEPIAIGGLELQRHLLLQEAARRALSIQFEHNCA